MLVRPVTAHKLGLEILKVDIPFQIKGFGGGMQKTVENYMNGGVLLGKIYIVPDARVDLVGIHVSTCDVGVT